MTAGRSAARGRQDRAGAYPAYLIRYRSAAGPEAEADPEGAGLPGPLFPNPAGPDSLMARGDAIFRAHAQPALDAAAATIAAIAALVGGQTDSPA